MSKQRPRLSPGLDAIKFAALALGILALLVGIAMYLIEGDLTIPVRVGVALGIILIGAYVAIDPEDALRRIAVRGTLYGGNTLVMAVVVLGILGLINVLAGRDPFTHRFDLTANQQFTLSDQSKTIVQQLPAPVHVTGFYSQNDRSQRETAENLLQQFQAAAPGKLTYEFVDPEQRPAVAQQAGVRQQGTVVFEMGDKKQNAISSSEQAFTSTLIKLTIPPRKVYFTTGHGERDTNRPDELGYSALLQLLQDENFEVDAVNLVASNKVPDDAAVLIIAAPTNPFLEAEKQAVQDYLARGGSLLLMAEVDTNPQVNDYISAWNVAFKFSPVIDPAQSLTGDPLTPLVSRYISHAITLNMNGIYTVWPLTAALTFPTDQTEGVFTAPLVETTDRSWLETNLQQEYQEQRVQFTPDQDTQGPISVMGVIEANAAQQPPADPNNPERPLKKTRIVVVADADFASNQLLRLASGNSDIFLNSMNWLSNADQLISIRSKESDIRQLVLSNTQMNLLIYSSVGFLPLLVLAAGAFVWWTRR